MLDMSITQIDPAVLAELPDSVRKEVLRSLAAPSAPQRPSNYRPLPAPALQHPVTVHPLAPVENDQLHVADLATLDLRGAARGPTLRECGEVDEVQWRMLHDLFPGTLLSDLLLSSASEGWAVIHGWIEEVLFAPLLGGGRNLTPGGVGGVSAGGMEVFVRPEQAAAIEQLLATWMKGFVTADLEGLQGVMRGLQHLGRQRSQLVGACTAAVSAVQEVIAEHYGGRVRMM